MEDSALEADLVATLEEAISELAPFVQGMCVLPQICAGLQSYGCIRLRDLRLMLSGDLLVLQAAIAPTPIIFLMTLKELVLASAQQTAYATSIVCILLAASREISSQACSTPARVHPRRRGLQEHSLAGDVSSSSSSI